MIVSGKNGELHYSPAYGSTVVFGPITIYSFVLEYQETLSTQFWSLGDNTSIQLYMPATGRLIVYGPGIDVDEELIFPANRYVVFRTYDKSGTAFLFFARPVVCDLMLRAMATQEPALSFKLEYDIVGYKVESIEETTLAATDICRFGPCNTSILFDGSALANWTAANFRLSYGVYDVTHTKPIVDASFFNHAVRGKYTNRGTVTVIAAISKQDGASVGRSDVLVEVPTLVGARKWEFKWMRFAGCSNYSVNRPTNQIVSFDANYAYTKMADSATNLGRIKLPSGTEV